MNEQERYELIEAFLRQELSAEDEASFRSQLDADADLREEVRLHAEVEGVLGDYQKFKAKERWSKLTPHPAKETDTENESASLKKIDAGERAPEQAQESAGIRRLLVPLVGLLAASLLIVFSLSYFMGSGTTSSYELADSFYEKPSRLISEQRGNRPAVDPIRDINLNFRRDRYDRAIAALISNTEISPRDRDLYMGICVYADDKAEQAVKILDPLVHDSRYEKREDVLWYSALAYLKIDKKDEARELLNTMLDEKIGRTPVIEELLGKIE